MPMMMIQVEETLLAMSQTVRMSGRYSNQSEGTNPQHAQYSTVQAAGAYLHSAVTDIAAVMLLEVPLDQISS